MNVFFTEISTIKTNLFELKFGTLFLYNCVSKENIFSWVDLEPIHIATPHSKKFPH